MSMEKKELWIENDYLRIPVWAGQPAEKLEVFCEEDGGARKVFEFCVPAGPPEPGTAKSFDAVLPVRCFAGKKLIISGNFLPEFFTGIRNVKNGRQESGGRRPGLHFTAEAGWINDPNGLVFHDGVYHLYFQYNPFDVVWNNMCWGHAVSTDLLHWEQRDTALFPDENGTMFSGSGIVNERGLLGLPEDALIFFYTAAAGCNEWTHEKAFTQRTACSTDGGRTLVKTGRGVLPPVGEESRDPKVFWHGESRAYIMVLWLYEDVFGIFRSKDLESWQESSRVKLEKGWECPDLFCLLDDSGTPQWVFLAADGSYYLGEFDGWRFRQTAERRCAYMNHAPYAAQTYSNVRDRRLLVEWLRLSFAGERYAGAMGLPRELSLTGTGNAARLCLKPARELAERLACSVDGREETGAMRPDLAAADGGGIAYVSVRCDDGGREYRWDVCGVAIRYGFADGAFAVNDESIALPAGIRDFSFFLDGPILEVTADGDTLLGAFKI